MDLTLLFPLLLLVLFVPMFLSVRKQKRQMSAMQSLQKSLEPGDVIVTTSGLRATVHDSSYEDTIDLEIADGVVTTWLRAAIREKVDVPVDEESTPTPVAEVESAAKDEEPAPAEGLSFEKTTDSPNGAPRT